MKREPWQAAKEALGIAAPALADHEWRVIATAVLTAATVAYADGDRAATLLEPAELDAIREATAKSRETFAAHLRTRAARARARVTHTDELTGEQCDEIANQLVRHLMHSVPSPGEAMVVLAHTLVGITLNSAGPNELLGEQFWTVFRDVTETLARGARLVKPS